MNINRYSLLQWAAQLACGIWIGILVFLGSVVAPSIFKFMESKTQAGALNGIILHKMNVVEGICAIILLLTSLVILFYRKSFLHWIRMFASLLLLCNLGWYSMIIAPRMDQLKVAIENLDMPKDQDNRPEREEFDRLHTVYSSMVTVNVIVLLALFFLISTTKLDEE
ncbi:DUF4149 domain-containing protein [bacterium]|nr:DUF4149 domain-containing protein [bacterium]